MRLIGSRLFGTEVGDTPIPFIRDLGGRKGDQIGPAVVFLCLHFQWMFKINRMLSGYVLTPLTRTWNNAVRRSGVDMVVIDKAYWKRGT